MAKGSRRGRSGARPKGDDAQKGAGREEAQKGGVDAGGKDAPAATDARDDARADKGQGNEALDAPAPKDTSGGAKGQREDAKDEKNDAQDDSGPKGSAGNEATGTDVPAATEPPNESTPNEPLPNELTPEATTSEPSPPDTGRDVAALHDTIARLQSELDDTQRAIAESHSAFAEQLVAMHTQHAQDLDEAVAKADAAHGQHADAQDATDRLEQLEKEHASLAKAHDEHKSALDAAHEAQRVSEQRTHDERVRLEREIEGVRAERDAARADLAAASATVTSLEAQLAERTASAQDVEALEQRIATLTTHAPTLAPPELLADIARSLGYSAPDYLHAAHNAKYTKLYTEAAACRAASQSTCAQIDLHLRPALDAVSAHADAVPDHVRTALAALRRALDAVE